MFIYSSLDSTFSVCKPLNVSAGTYVTNVYNLFAESSSSFRRRAKRTRTRNGVLLLNFIEKKKNMSFKESKQQRNV